MNHPCPHRQEQIEALITGGLSPEESNDLHRHIEQCPACREYFELLNGDSDRLAQFAEAMGPTIARLETNVLEILDRAAASAPARAPSIWRMIMKSRIAKLAAAAIILIVVGLTFFGLFEGTSVPAYAIEQTIEACRGIRTMHIRFFSPYTLQGVGFGDGEMWIQFDEKGELQRLRSEVANSPDGPKAYVWQKGKIDLYFKGKNSLLILSDADRKVADFIRQLRQLVDASEAMHRLREMQAQGKVELTIEQPGSAEKPIVLTATLPPQEGHPRQRQVSFIDPKTKLLKQSESFSLKDDKWELQQRIEYLEYNEPIDPERFALNVPPGVMRINQTAQDIGLPKGDLTDEEIAAKVVREFCEALIAGDYEKASRLYEGVPPDVLRKALAGSKVVRIVSIGKPTAHPETESLKVPLTLEFEKGGVKEVKEIAPGPFVRHVYARPDRWTISGGF